MKIPVSLACVLVMPLVASFGARSKAEEIRISFLTNSAALEDTVKVLMSNGCAEETTKAFRKAVEGYYKAGFDFDYSKFPAPSAGFYTFASPTQLLAALPRHFADTPHAWGYNCLDCTILLASGDLRCGLTNDAIAGPFLVPQYDPSGFTAITSRASARDAFEAACPQDYREASEPFVPSAMREQRISLIASLYSARMLRYSTTEQTLQQEVFEALKTDCRKESVQFPRGFEVVLCHETSLSNHFFVFAHSGLLFKTSDHYCYIEKAGAPGPFVRLDFAGRATLTAWLTGTFRVTGRFEPSERFVTYNNTKIEKLPPAVWPANSISPINAAVTH